MTDLRYPIGPFSGPTQLTSEERRAHIEHIAEAPSALRAAVSGLDGRQLDTPYRDGGWTVRQVVHHLPDSHMNAFVRLKLALTEDSPTIRPYDESAWAKLGDVQATPPEVSLVLLESLHARWVALFRTLHDDDFRRTFRHPEHPGTQTIDWLVASYSWHGRHHVAQITSLLTRMGW